MPAPLNIPASMASGVTKSGFATSLAPKVVGDVAASGATSLGLGTLLGALGPAYTIYSVLDALGFFDKGMEATPMTPEEAAEYEATSRLALAQSGMQEGGEGAYEMLMDALAQASDTEGVSEQEIADILGQSGYITSLTGAPGGSTQPTLVEMTQEKINKAASAVGKAQDTLFDIFGIPKPDYSVIQPNAPGGTVIWGEPSGGVFGRIGTTPGGTKVGVQTGIPALDVVLGRVADIVSGRAAAGEVLNTETIKEIILQTAGDELGIPGDPNKVLAEIENISNQVFLDKDTGKLGIDPFGGAAPDVVPEVVPEVKPDVKPDVKPSDRTPTLDLPTFPTDRGPTLALPDFPTLELPRGGTLTLPDFDPTETERIPTTVSPTTPTDEVPTPADEAPGGGGGVGLGETGVTPTGGMRGVATEQAGVADITMLYDPSLSLAENMARILGKKKNEQADAVDSALMYGGGIVQPTDLNNELLRILEGR